MKPSFIEIKISENRNSKWNIDIEGDSVFKIIKKKKESWSSNGMEAKEIWECSNVTTCLGQDHWKDTKINLKWENNVEPVPR